LRVIRSIVQTRTLDKFVSLLEELHVEAVRDSEEELSQIINTMNDYKLAPRDAIIALTCKYYGINTILTFDEDFKRIPWLKVIS